jgi:succinate dehydrogenase/fumarate reductase flavoprotein subunit
MVKIWDSWGIPMKYNGRWEFAGHALPGRPRLFLKYAGGNQKPVLTKQAVKRGVDIKKRVTVFELLKDEEKVTGAIGYDTWQDKIIEFHAKFVFLGTGSCSRLYKGSTSAMFNLPNTPYDTGDGRAMALRVGADLINSEMTLVWAGPKYFARCGKATWIGVYRDASGNPVGPFVNKPNIEYGDVIADAFPSVFDEYMKSGKGPVYNDCKGATNEEMEYMIHWLRNEGNEGLIRYLQRENIDLREHAVEFRTYEPFVAGGVWFSNSSQTSVKGLYAAGDEYFGGMANSVVWGWIAGETMARDLKGISLGDPSKTEEQSKAKVDMVQNILNRKEGPDWEEANIAVQEIMHDYVGSVRSESLLQQADRNLKRLKENSYQSLKATNGHELGRCLEVFNLIDVGEAVIFAAQERKESRRTHRRSDYPFSNPLLDMQLVVTKKDGKLVGQWKA